MTPKSPVSVRIHRAALIALLPLMLLPGCKTLPQHSKPTQPPTVRCEERSPTEPATQVDAASEDWRYWYGKWLEQIGKTTAEKQKRATTADCLDRLRELDVIR